MPPWWGKSSSKETTTTTTKKKTKENLMDTLHRFISPPSDQKGSNESKKKRSSYATSAKGSQSRAESRSTSPSNKNVSRCQSFSDRPHPLPLPHRPAGVTRTASEVGISRPLLEKRGKPQLHLPLPKPSSRPEPNEPGADFPTPASISSNCSVDSDDPFACGGSQMHSPAGTDAENGNNNVRIPRKNYASSLHRDQSQSQSQSQPQPQPVLHQKPQPPRPTTRPISPRISAPNSLRSSPSRSPRRICPDQILPSAFFALRSNDISFMGNSSGQGSPGSGQTSGHNSVGGDMLGQLLWQQQSLQSRGSPECSPLVSPRLMSPGPGSRIHSGNVSPLHPRAGGESPSKQTHRLPLPPPPVNISNNNNNSNNNGNGSFVNNGSNGPSRSPPPSPGSRWKKGKLLGRGTFGHVYVGFNSDSGEMCAMKEVTIFLDDPKSKESQKQLSQEIFLLSKLRHPNIVQYYGSETVEDRLYIYLEYVSGGSIHRLLQEYGQFGEPAIRSYTQQILSGLAYLHAKNTVHRDIKGANILVDPNGRVKLADFGMAKHISGQSCPFSFKGSPYWMAPEVIKNANGCNLAVDIWSLGCTVLEMATSKPPWSQYEGIAAMFKIGNSKELPSIPDHLSDEGKDFIRRCLQREPINRPSASDLLRHPFVQNATPIERFYSLGDPPLTDRLVSNSSNLSFPKGGGGHLRNLSSLGNEGQSMSIQQRRGAKITSISSDIHLRNNISCPVSPSRSPILRSRSPRNGQMSPSPISSPRTASGASTPLTGHLHFNNHFNHSNGNYDGFVPSFRVQRVISESDILNPHYGNNSNNNNGNGNGNGNGNRSNNNNGNSNNRSNGGNGLSRIRLNPALDLRPK